MAGPDLPSIITSAVSPRELKPRHDLREPGWMFWERRTLNMHRVVGLLQPYRQLADAHDLGATIRGAVARNFRRSWWRGLGLGVVAEIASTHLTADDLKAVVDVRESSTGTVQWIILAAGDTHVAVGVHTWMETYLSSVYRATLDGLAGAGCQVSSGTKDKDGLMKLITWLSRGTGKRAFPAFRDPRQA